MTNFDMEVWLRYNKVHFEQKDWKWRLEKIMWATVVPVRSWQ
jgi:hypothetical protein